MEENTAALVGQPNAALAATLESLSSGAITCLLSNPLPQINTTDLAEAARILGTDTLDLADAPTILAPLLGGGVDLSNPQSSAVLTTLLGLDVLGPVSANALSRLLGLSEAKLIALLGAERFERAPVQPSGGLAAMAAAAARAAEMHKAHASQQMMRSAPPMRPMPVPLSPGPVAGAPMPNAMGMAMGGYPPPGTAVEAEQPADMGEMGPPSACASMLQATPKASAKGGSVPGVASEGYDHEAEQRQVHEEAQQQPPPQHQQHQQHQQHHVEEQAEEKEPTRPSPSLSSILGSSALSPELADSGSALDVLAALTNKEESAKKMPGMVKTSVPAPVSGYARASVMSRIVEQKEGNRNSEGGQQDGGSSEQPLLLDSAAANAFSMKMLERRVTVQSAFEAQEQPHKKPKPELEQIEREALAAGARIFIGNIPHGTPESSIRLECSKYGAVTSIQHNEGGDVIKGASATVGYGTPEMAANALLRLRQQAANLFNAFEPLDVRFADMRPKEEELMKAPEPAEKDRRDDQRDGGRRRRSRSRGRRSRSRGRRRFRDQSGDEAPPSAPPPPAPVGNRKRGLGGFDADIGGMNGAAETIPVPIIEARPRQVAARGAWAQFMTAEGAAYFHNIYTGATTWEQPLDFAVPVPRRIEQGSSETSVYIFHLPPAWTEEDLLQHFRPYGQVIRAVVQRGANNGLSRGFGFVAYGRKQEAEVAANAMNGFYVDGKWLKVLLKGLPRDALDMEHM